MSTNGNNQESTSNKRQKTKHNNNNSNNMGANQNYYDMLGVSKTATSEELRKAYKKQAVKWHPDKHASKSDEEKQDAEDRFKQMAEVSTYYMY